MDNELKQYLTTRETWIRGLYILLFSLCYSVAEVVLFAVVFFQFLSLLFSGQVNERLSMLGQSLATYIYQIIQYITVNSEHQPFPLGNWPQGNPENNPED